MEEEKRRHFDDEQRNALKKTACSIQITSLT
jgi:hypothetical protein